MRVRRQFHLDRALAALAVLCLLMMPIEYRGGAEEPHPHAVFQFWDSGNRDAFDHHGHAHAAAAVPRADASEAPTDVPIVTEMTASAERAVGFAVAVSALFLLLSLTRVRRLSIPRTAVPDGLEPVPDVPPPRSVLAPG